MTLFKRRKQALQADEPSLSDVHFPDLLALYRAFGSNRFPDEEHGIPIRRNLLHAPLSHLKDAGLVIRAEGSMDDMRIAPAVAGFIEYMTQVHDEKLARYTVRKEKEKEKEKSVDDINKSVNFPTVGDTSEYLELSCVVIDVLPARYSTSDRAWELYDFRWKNHIRMSAQMSDAGFLPEPEMPEETLQPPVVVLEYIDAELNIKTKKIVGADLINAVFGKE